MLCRFGELDKSSPRAGRDGGRQLGMRIKLGRGHDDGSWSWIVAQQVVQGHGGVGNAAGLDGDEWAGALHAVAINAADVAERVEGESAAGDFLVRVKYLFSKGREEHGVILAVRRGR